MTSALAGLYNMTCDQGATLDKSITWSDSAKNPYNLTNFTARMQVRSAVSSTIKVLELTTENGRIILHGAVDYNINLLVDATTTAALAPGLYVYDLEIVSPAGKVTRLIEGNFKVKAEVTR
jgi:hypothetical protein